MKTSLAEIGCNRGADRLLISGAKARAGRERLVGSDSAGSDSHDARDGSIIAVSASRRKRLRLFRRREGG